MFSDLETDYINPIDLCNKLNQVLNPILFIFPMILVFNPLISTIWHDVLVFNSLCFLNISHTPSYRSSSSSPVNSQLSYSTPLCSHITSASSYFPFKQPTRLVYSDNHPFPLDALSGLWAQTTCTTPQRFSEVCQTTSGRRSSSWGSTCLVSSTISIGPSLSLSLFKALWHPHFPPLHPQRDTHTEWFWLLLLTVNDDDDT